MKELLELSSFRGNDTPILIDIGDPDGLHGIYASKIGYKTWIKEEDETNLMQVKWNLTYLIYDTFIYFTKVLRLMNKTFLDL